MSDDASEALVAVAESLAEIERRIKQPDAATQFGKGFILDARNVIAAFRQRNPSAWPGGQPGLPLD